MAPLKGELAAKQTEGLSPKDFPRLDKREEKCVFVPGRNEDAFGLTWTKLSGTHTVTGLREGLMISLQSRSPRSRPWIRISAVAALVAKGMLY